MVTVTLTTFPDKPDTLMFEGYRLAGPLSGMVIVVELVNAPGGHVGVAEGVPVGVAVAGAVGVGVAVAGAVAVGVALGEAVGVGVGDVHGVRM
jgi:hypothetical protein